MTWADAAAFAAMLVWGANFPVIKRLMGVIDPIPLMFIRGSASSVLLTAMLWRRGGWRVPDRAEIPTLLGVGLLGHTLNQILYAVGLSLTTASHSGLIFTLTPLFVFGLSHVLGHVRIRGVDLIGLGLGIGGAGLILGAPVIGGTVTTAAVSGDLLTLGSAILWGAWTIVAAPLLRRRGTLVGTTWITIVGTIGLVPFAVPGLARQDWRLSGSVIASLIYASTIGGPLGSLLWYAAVRRLGAARAMIYANLEAFFAVAAAALMLGERVEATAVLGGVTIVIGVLLTRRGG